MNAMASIFRERWWLRHCLWFGTLALFYLSCAEAERELMYLFPKHPCPVRTAMNNEDDF
jgi:hypothetical protein